MRFVIAAAFITAVSAGGAAAQDCENPQFQAEMNACAGIAYEEADARLNAAYRELRATLSDDEHGRSLLTISQRAWIAFRDAECDFRARSVLGGTMYPMVLSYCLADLTDQRTAELEHYGDCPEGDVGC